MHLFIEFSLCSLSVGCKSSLQRGNQKWCVFSFTLASLTYTCHVLVLVRLLFNQSRFPFFFAKHQFDMECTSFFFVHCSWFSTIRTMYNLFLYGLFRRVSPLFVEAFFGRNVVLIPPFSPYVIYDVFSDTFLRLFCKLYLLVVDHFDKFALCCASTSNLESYYYYIEYHFWCVFAPTFVIVMTP